MKQSSRASLAVAVLLAGVVAATVFTGLPHHRLGDAATDADHVTLYQNGYAAVRLERAFESVGGEQVLEFLVPTTTIFDSIRLEGAEGVTVAEFRSSLAADPILQPGDRLIVRLDDGTSYDGTLLAFSGGQLMMQSGEDSVLIDPAHIVAYELPGEGVEPAGAGSTKLLVRVHAPEGNQSVKLSYIAQGPKWVPNHFMDTADGAWTFFATLEGMFDWRGVSIDLVAGSPNVVFHRSAPTSTPPPRTFAPEAASADSGGGAAGAYSVGFGGSESVGDLYRFSYDGRLDFERGQTVRLPVLTGTVDIERHYYAAQVGRGEQKVSATDTYWIHNTLGETIPGGAVQLFTDGEWVGGASVGTLGRGEQTNLSASRSHDVKVEVKELSVDSQQTGTDSATRRPTGTDTHRVRVTFENMKAEDIEYRLVMDVGAHRTRIIEAQPAPDEQVGGRLEWDGSLDGGESDIFLVTWAEDWTR